MVKNLKRADFLWRGLSVLSVLLIYGCASSARFGSNKDPFSDPSKIENLVSNVPQVEAPGPITLAPVPASVEKTKVLDGDSLYSPALLNAPADEFAATIESSLTSRTPASVTSVSASNGEESPAMAFTNLIMGNKRYVTGAVTGERRDQTRRNSLVSKQHPQAIVLSCSDSRLPPELIFDQGLGDLFTIRVAGNILGAAQVATIEYGIEHLGAKLIVILGHESCGAVKAALDSKPNVSSGSPDLDWLVSAIKPNLGKGSSASYTSSDPKLRKPVTSNVDAVTEQLLARSKIVSDAIAEGKLKTVRGIYSLDTGKVEFWGLK